MTCFYGLMMILYLLWHDHCTVESVWLTALPSSLWHLDKSNRWWSAERTAGRLSHFSVCYLSFAAQAQCQRRPATPALQTQWTQTKYIILECSLFVIKSYKAGKRYWAAELAVVVFYSAAVSVWCALVKDNKHTSGELNWHYSLFLLRLCVKTVCVCMCV